MTPLDAIVSAAKADPRRIVLAEGEDPRIVAGALRAARDGLAQITLLGSEDKVRSVFHAQDEKPDGIAIVDPARSRLLDEFADAYHQLRRHKGVDAAAARAAMLEPLGFAAMMVRSGHAEGTIAGAVCTTAETVRAALQIIGRAPGIAMVSSFFLMLLSEPHHPRQGVFVFADCALVVEPDAAELAVIATASADSFVRMTGKGAKVAMLSFSTHGSASHERVTKVIDATAIARQARPDLVIDGDLQFDAAFVPSVAARKAPGSPVGAEANVFVFPSLEAANIGYKIAQRIGGAQAIGPVLQGLAKPANDLSRGCNADDVYYLIAITAVQAARSGR